MAGNAKPERSEPRRHLIEPVYFGLQAAALWLPETDPSERLERIFAYQQHLAVCVIRDIYMVDPVGELTRRIEATGLVGKISRVYLTRKISGELSTSKRDLVLWSIALDNISLHPAPGSINDLHPPVGERED